MSAQLSCNPKRPLTDSKRQLQSHQSALQFCWYSLCVSVHYPDIDFAEVLWSAMRVQLLRWLSLETPIRHQNGGFYEITFQPLDQTLVMGTLKKLLFLCAIHLCPSRHFERFL